MVEIDVTCNLESFRRFLINSTCMSYIPESYLRDFEVFPEKEGDQGSIYIEAADKVTLKKIRDITFINATDILGIIYTSKSGNSRLKWRQVRNRVGRVTGEASTNSLVNLSMARVITPEYVEELVSRSGGGGGGGEEEPGAERPMFEGAPPEEPETGDEEAAGEERPAEPGLQTKGEEPDEGEEGWKGEEGGDGEEEEEEEEETA